MKSYQLSLLIYFCLQVGANAQLTDFDGINFSKADSIALSYVDFPINHLGALSDSLTYKLSTDVEKLRSIYTWVCMNIENSYVLYNKNKKQRERLSGPELAEWNKKLNRVVFSTLIEKKSTICTGYAYLIKELSMYAGIPCEMVDGYGRSPYSNLKPPGIPNHTWNAVQLNNKWYLCDGTWSSGAIDATNKRFRQNYNDDYFLMEPSSFVKNHYPIDTAWILMKKKPSLEEFLTRPLIYRSLFSQDIDGIIPNSFQLEVTRDSLVTFQFQQTPIKNKIDVALQIDYKGRTYSLTPKVDQTAEGQYSFSHSFSKKGMYILHVELNGDVVYTHRVIVK